MNTISVEFENKVTGIGGLLISSRTSEPKILGFLSRHEYSEQDIIHFGIPLASIRPIINILSSKFNAFSIPSSLGSCNNPYYLKFSGIELSFVSIAEANSLGLSSEWCDRLTIAKKDQVICIGKVTASCTYRSGDFLLSIEGKLVSSLMDIQWIENQQFTEWNSIVFRNGFEITQSHSLQKYPINGDFSGFVPKIQCLVCFSGAIIKWSGCQVFKHENFSKFPYISGVLKGSPANIAGISNSVNLRTKLGISAGFFILRVNGQSISNLNDTCSDSITDTMEAFIYYLKSSVSKNRSVQFELQHWITGAKWIISFVPDEHYWNSWYLTTSRGGELILETL